MSFNSLTKDVIFIILRNLTLEELIRFCAVNKKWHKKSQERNFLFKTLNPRDRLINNYAKLNSEYISQLKSHISKGNLVGEFSLILRLMSLAVKYKLMDWIDYILSISQETEDKQHTLSTGFVEAIKINDTRLVDFFVDKGVKIDCGILSLVISLEMMKHVIKVGEILPHDKRLTKEVFSLYENKKYELADHLANFGFNDAKLIKACYHNDTKQAIKIIDNGTKYVREAFFVAINNNNVELLKYLIDNQCPDMKEIDLLISYVNFRNYRPIRHQIIDVLNEYHDFLNEVENERYESFFTALLN